MKTILNTKTTSYFRVILAPLAVMLLLTVLMGYSTYSLTQSWGSAIEHVGRRMTDTVILNNIRWQAYQAQQLIDHVPPDASAEEMATRQQAAKKLWISISQQFRNLSPDFAQFQSIYLYLLQQPMSVSVLHQMASQDVLKKQLDDTQRELGILQRDAQGATVTLTLSMTALGLLLMVITTRELGKLIQQLKQSRDRAVAIQEEERRRIAQDIHDGVIQDLIVLKRQYQSGENPDVQMDYMIQELRRICQNLKPQLLEDLGLQTALESLVQELRHQTLAPVTLDLHLLNTLAIPKSVELQLFRVMQELVSNIKRHAEAKNVTIRLEPGFRKNTLQGLVQDDGIGFEMNNLSSSGMGLTGVSERIAQMGGQLQVVSVPGKGTSFQFEIPLSPISRKKLGNSVK